MKRRTAFVLNTLGWLMLFFALLMSGIRDVGLDPQLYFNLQMEAGILEEAGISETDLMQLDVGLARYLGGKQDDLDYSISVFGQIQPAFNSKEIQHMQDCRKLFAPVRSMWLNIALAVCGAALVFCGRKQKTACAWLASAVFILPVGMLALWAAIDFNSAFNFFHRMLFTNDLWLLNPETDLLIRICPQSMFANMGLHIALKSAAILLGLPLLVTIVNRISEKRKRKQNEVSDL